MKLYFSPGSCSLASHIVLRELGYQFETERVDLRSKKTAGGADYSQINPKGYVPALRLDDGALLTEGPVIMQYLADTRPAAGLVPANGTMDRYRLQEWLGFINSELHKSYSPLFYPTTPDAVKQASIERIGKRLDLIEATLANQDYLLGQLSVADIYLFVVTGWSPAVSLSLEPWPKVRALQARIAARPAVQAAQAAEKAS